MSITNESDHLEQPARKGASIVGFGIDGVDIASPRPGSPFHMKSIYTLRNFGLNAGDWNTDRHVRLLANTTGNKRKDIVGFGESGVWVAPAIAATDDLFDTPRLVLADFGWDNGWRIDKHIRLMADIRNIGRTDIVGFGEAGVLVSLNMRNSEFTSAHITCRSFGYRQGWRTEKYPRYLADTTADGLPDIVGFGESHVYVGRNRGDGTFQDPQPVLQQFTYQDGWRVEEHPRFLADLTGDGRADIIGFKDSGVFVSLNDGKGRFRPATKVVDGFDTTRGWKVDRHPRYVVPLTRKKAADIIGFAYGGVYVSFNNGDGTFQPAKRVVDDFGWDQGWRVDQHPRFIVDMTGNGLADIVGFGSEAVWVSYNNGDGTFQSPAVKLVEKNFSYSEGWSIDKTVRYICEL